MPSQSTNLKAHPAAAIFPELQGDAYAALVEDIHKHGQIQPIILLNGEVLDGRTRLRVCRDLDILPKFESFKGDSPTAFVLSMNIHRRHLTDDQRAAIAALSLPLFQEEAKKRQKAHGRTAPGKPSLSPEPDEVKDPNEKRATAQAGKSVGVSRSKTERAAKVLEAAPELFEAVKSGEMKLAKAEAVINAEAEDELIAATDDGTVAAARLRYRYAQIIKQACAVTFLDQEAVISTFSPDDVEFERANVAQLLTWFGTMDRLLKEPNIRIVR